MMFSGEMRITDFSIFSRYRAVLMGIAILGVMILHGIGWAEIGDSLFDKIVSPFARIAFTDGFIFLSGFGLFYSFKKNILGYSYSIYTNSYDIIYNPAICGSLFPYT